MEIGKDPAPSRHWWHKSSSNSNPSAYSITSITQVGMCQQKMITWVSHTPLPLCWEFASGNYEMAAATKGKTW
jgi:hypothetical protein